MSNFNQDTNHSRQPSSGSGIRLPPISFLGNLNNPSHSPPLPPQSLPPSTGTSSKSQDQSQQSSAIPSQLGSNNILNSSKSDTPDSSAVGTSLPPLNNEPAMGGFTHSRLPSLDNSNTDEKRSIYSLPTPVQLGIDVRKQNLPNMNENQELLLQQQLLQRRREDEELREKRLKEERKRKNRERREREKLLKQQQQVLYGHQNEFERRRILEENETRNDMVGPTATGGYYPSQEQHPQQHPLKSQSPGSYPKQQQQPQQPPYLHEKHPYNDNIQEEVVPFKKQVTTINNSSVLEDAEIFPRSHIGTILYQQYPTRSTVIRKLRLTKDHEQRLLEDEEDYQHYIRKNRHSLKNKPSKIINLLPPYLKFYINSLVDIKISYKDIVKNENVYKRNLWGTDIYTDDSDIVAILYHCGIIPSKSPFGDDNPQITASTLGNKLNNHSIQKLPSSEGDLIVTLIILPALVSYQGSYRNNYNSRSWLSTHDGGSILIYNVKWCHLGESYKDTHHSDIKRTQLTDVALMKHQMEENAKYLSQLQQEGNQNKSPVEVLLNNWNVDKNYLSSDQAKVRQLVKAETNAAAAAAASNEDEKLLLLLNDTTILLNQTTQIHHTDDTTIPEITKHDDTTIDDR